MEAEFKEKTVIETPSLTLEPNLDTETAIAAPVQTEVAEQKIPEPILTPEEQEMVTAFAATIDVENTAQILQYGAGTQKKMADFSDSALANVRAQDLGEVGDLIVSVVGELKGFDAEEEKGLFSFFKKQTGKLELMKARYDKAEVSVNKICDALTQHQVRLLKDSAVLDQMYQQNLAYFKELTMYIMAGRQKLDEVRNGKLAQMEETARKTGLAEDVQAAKDLADKCERFEKKIYDLELTRAISIQTAPQIRMIQNNDNVMVEKIQTTLVNTIPLWKNQMVISLGIAHSTEAAKAQRQVNDVTNALLQANARKLHIASVETAKEAERGIVDIETLKKTNAELIQTLDDVMKIQSDGRAQRLNAEAEMAKMENDLKMKLLQIRESSPKQQSPNRKKDIPDFVFPVCPFLFRKRIGCGWNRCHRRCRCCAGRCQRCCRRTGLCRPSWRCRYPCPAGSDSPPGCPAGSAPRRRCPDSGHLCR